MIRRIPGRVLILITIIIIIAFQVYWLKDNYEREKKTLEIKTANSFQETVQLLQAAKLKLPEAYKTIINDSESNAKKYLADTSSKLKKITIANIFTKKAAGFIKVDSVLNPALIATPVKHSPDSGLKNKEIFISKDFTLERVFKIAVPRDTNDIARVVPFTYKKYDSTFNGKYTFVEKDFNVDNAYRRQIISIVKTLGSKFNDSIKISHFKNPKALVIGYRDSYHTQTNSSAKIKRYIDTGNHLYKVLFSVDSLQDSLHIPEIAKAYSASLRKQKIEVPFTISKLQKEKYGEEQDMFNITIGFAHPVTYHLSLGNTDSFIFKKLTLPILFSLFLISITIFSFILLFRNLLKQQRLAEIKNEFISNITHELKTPISTVSVAIEAMKNFNALQNPQRTAEYLDIAENELQRLTMLVDKVLKLSMFEQQQIELTYEPFDVHKLAAEVIGSMQIQFEKNKAIVTLESKGTDFNINADRLHIISVIYNLLDNALKYSSEHPQVKILIEENDKDIQFSIVDKGKGIAQVYKDRIFEKFFRVPQGGAHNTKGYGLGLSYVSHIVAKHKGTISVESELDKGSTFIIKLPKMYGEN